MSRLCNAATCPGVCGRGVENFVVPALGKVFLAAITVDTIFSLALSIALLAQPDTSQQGTVYALLGGFCTLGLAYFAYDAVWTENRTQYIFCHITAALFCFFVIWESIRNGGSMGGVWSQLHWGAVGVKCTFQAAYLGLAKPVWDSFGFFAYKVAGADPHLKDMYSRYRTFLTCIKYDVFCSVVLFLLVSVYLITAASADFVLGLLSLLASGAFLVTGWYGIATERRGVVLAFLLLALLQPAYIGFKSWSIENNPAVVPANVTLTQFVVLGVLTVALRVLVVLTAYRCYLDFDHGLKELVFFGKRAAAAHRYGGARRGTAEVILAPSAERETSGLIEEEVLSA